MSLIQALQTQLPTYALQVVRLIVWLVLLGALFVPLETFFALRARNVRGSNLLQDLAYYFMSSLVPMVFVAIPMALLVAAMLRVLPDGYLAAIAGINPVVRLALVFVIGEIGFYWGHRLCHELPWLWRFHAIHHGPDHLYFLANSRAHPVDLVVTRMFGLVPIYALGLAGHGSGGNLAPVLLVLTGTLWGFFVHANLRVRLGPLEWIIATPAFHHWHHSRVEHINHNYASMLPLLDRVFGSYYLPTAWPKEYGVQADLPESLAGQILFPFQSKRTPDAISSDAMNSN